MLPKPTTIALRAFGRARELTVAALFAAAVSGLTFASAVTLGSGAAEAKTPGRTYCFNGVCHRVKTLAETRREVGRRQVLIASHYDSCHRDRFNPCGLTSSGERYRPGLPNNAASPNYPNGTLLLVWHPRTKKTVVVRINNAGPYWGNRRLDLSRAAAQRLGFRGVARVHVTVLKAPTASQARYKRNRVYRPAPGYVGRHASFGAAAANVRSRYAGVVGGRSTGRSYRVASADVSRPSRTERRRKSAQRSRTSRTTLRNRSVRQQRIVEVRERRSKVVRTARGERSAGRRIVSSDRRSTGGGPKWFRDSVSKYKAKRGGKRVRQSRRSGAASGNAS